MNASFRNKMLFLSAAAVLTFTACSNYVAKEPTDTKDLSYIYNPARNVFTPHFTIYNENDEVSLLSVRLSQSEIVFSEANIENTPMASILLSVKLYDNTLGGELADTSLYRFDIRKEEVHGEYVLRVPVKAYEGKSYTAAVKIIDLIRQRTVQLFIDFDKTGPYSRHNYMVRSHFTRSELFNSVVTRDQYINILYPHRSIDTLWLFYYKAVKDVPPGPSTVLPEVTVSEEPEVAIALSYSDTLPIMFPREGIYLLSIDSTRREGLTLFNFGPDHPSMTTPETMIPPLAYIATRDEMEAMLTSENPKLALDEFWLARTGSIERSKELIRVYYIRVLFSNYYFSSYKPGWLTDRGMIYIIYGPPDKLYKNSDGESWGYKKPAEESRWGSGYSVEDSYLWFNFRKQRSIFTDNDFVLNRAGTPVSYWDIAVARWREGVIFRIDNPVEKK